MIRLTAIAIRAGHFLTENRSPNRTEPNRTESVGFSVFGFGFGFQILLTDVIGSASVLVTGAPNSRTNRSWQLHPPSASDPAPFPTSTLCPGSPSSFLAQQRSPVLTHTDC